MNDIFNPLQRLLMFDQTPSQRTLVQPLILLIFVKQNEPSSLVVLVTTQTRLHLHLLSQCLVLDLMDALSARTDTLSTGDIIEV